MMKKISLGAVAAFILAISHFSHAQQPKKVPRIAYLSSQDSARESARSEPIRLALRERGYIEGKNIAFEYRYAEGKRDRQAEVAAELVRLKVDIIVVVGGGNWVLAAKNATKTIPVVMVGSGIDPVEFGLLKALPVPAATSPVLQILAGN